MDMSKADWSTWLLIGAAIYALYVTDMFRKL